MQGTKTTAFLGSAVSLEQVQTGAHHKIKASYRQVKNRENKKKFKVYEVQHNIAPLLFLLSLDHSGKGYGSVREEAVKLFNCLQQLESAREPVPIIQGVLQTCLDLRPLRDEVYCQLVKQTSYTPAPYTAAHLRYWQLLTCMSCTFLPGPTVLKYLRFHLKRWDAHKGYLSIQLTLMFLSIF